jgi:hypothetical protein
VTDRYERADDCDLCEAARITPWYHEDDICWIAECEICATPMVVWRGHGVAPPADELAHMHSQLANVVLEYFGSDTHDDHAQHRPLPRGRPVGGFFGHGMKPAARNNAAPTSDPPTTAFAPDGRAPDLRLANG